TFKKTILLHTLNKLVLKADQNDVGNYNVQELRDDVGNYDVQEPSDDVSNYDVQEPSDDVGNYDIQDLCDHILNTLSSENNEEVYNEMADLCE
ncbi:10132_t:CDS:2, partial [Cetraspora pellucida]